MMYTRLKQQMVTTSIRQLIRNCKAILVRQCLQSRFYRQAILVAFTLAMLLGSMVVANFQAAQANGCSWHRVVRGDTLSGLAWRYHSTVRVLASASDVDNVNLIFVGQNLCIPTTQGRWNGTSVFHNTGSSAPQNSSRSQVITLLRQAARQHGLPANLVLAIAWQESGFNPRAMARDGGFGVMQLMPATAAGINPRLSRYNLYDNIQLGTTYLSFLYRNFHGNLAQTASAYNAGGWTVQHRGIINPRYVNSVLNLMRRF